MLIVGCYRERTEAGLHPETDGFQRHYSGITNQKYRLALAGITITDERKKAIDFSDGYYKSGLLVMVKANNNDIKSVKDLDGKVVAVKSGTGSVDYAKANIKTKDLRQFPTLITRTWN